METGLSEVSSKVREINDSHPRSFSGYRPGSVCRDVKAMLEEAQDPNLVRVSKELGKPIVFREYDRASGSKNWRGWCLYIYGEVKDGHVTLRFVETKTTAQDNVHWPRININNYGKSIGSNEARELTPEDIDRLRMLDRAKFKKGRIDAIVKEKEEDVKYLIIKQKQPVKLGSHYYIFKLPKSSRAGRLGSAYEVDVNQNVLWKNHKIVSRDYVSWEEAPNTVKGSIIGDELTNQQ